MGREAAGVRGIRLARGQRVTSLIVLGEGLVLTVSEHGYGKLTAVEEFPVHGRGGKGVKVGDVPLAWFGPRADLHLSVGGEPTVVRGDDVATGRRTGKGSPLGGTVMGVVTGEVVPDAAG